MPRYSISWTPAIDEDDQGVHSFKVSDREFGPPYTVESITAEVERMIWESFNDGISVSPKYNIYDVVSDIAADLAIPRHRWAIEEKKRKDELEAKYAAQRAKGEKFREDA